MEQGTVTQPNLQSLERTSGKIIVFPTGSAGGLDLGVIEIVKVAYGVKSDAVMFAIDGNVVLGTKENVSVEPVLTMTGQQFHSAVRALLLLGTKNADVVQTSGSAATLTVTAKLGQTFDIGARNLSNVVVTVAAAVKVEGTDYFLEPSKGLIRFPAVAAGIADGASVLITFDKAALTRESITAFTNLNQTATVKYYEMDNKSATVRNEWTITGTLSVTAAGDADPTKFKKWTAELAVSGQPTVLSRVT
jgi:5-enolpyruvylshikimate-3-phosphate synthase